MDFFNEKFKIHDCNKTVSDPPLTPTDHPAISDVSQGGESHIPADTVDTADLASAAVSKQPEVRSQSETQVEAVAKKFCEKQTVTSKTANKPRDRQNKPKEKGTRHQLSPLFHLSKATEAEQARREIPPRLMIDLQAVGLAIPFLKKGKRKQEDTIERSPFKRPSIPYS
ncbi:hypothetical protein ElyMa_006064800 [Elysia marginata]|uniref:Uncharacterized protein n=1 Tax=Elysia marginata TaxID=1093978 RepID=A0AAV4GQR1_9GAST|nr:hypothetical protein ElyMa_006064800 [Elysia marginata]